MDPIGNTVADPELNLGGGGGFLEDRRAEWGGYGRGVPSRWWGFGGPPPRKFWKKMMQNGAIWSVIKAF